MVYNWYTFLLSFFCIETLNLLWLQKDMREGSLSAFDGECGYRCGMKQCHEVGSIEVEGRGLAWQS